MSGQAARPHDVSGSPGAVVLMLHGGWPTGSMRIRGWYPPVVQNQRLARSLAPVLARHGAVAVQVRNRVRGWNDPELPAVRDALAAVAEVRRRHGDVPLVLLGYSMGARTAARVAGQVGAVGVVALAPWWPEPEAGPVGVPTAVVHGSADLLCPAGRTALVTGALAADGAPVRRRQLAGAGHFMLLRRRDWFSAAGQAVDWLLGGVDPAAESAPNLLGRLDAVRRSWSRRAGDHHVLRGDP